MEVVGSMGVSIKPGGSEASASNSSTTSIGSVQSQGASASPGRSARH